MYLVKTKHERQGLNQARKTKLLTEWEVLLSLAMMMQAKSLYCFAKQI